MAVRRRDGNRCRGMQGMGWAGHYLGRRRCRRSWWRGEGGGCWINWVEEGLAWKGWYEVRIGCMNGLRWCDLCVVTKVTG